MLTILAISLGLTLVAEPVFAYVYGLRTRRALLLVALVNLLTNPPVVLLYYILTDHTLLTGAAVKALLELAAVAVEGLYYRRYAKSIKRPFLFSLSANALSFTLGLIVNAF